MLEICKSFIYEDATEEEVFELLQACARRLNWLVAIEADQEIVRGLSLGTQAYLDENLKRRA